MRLTLTKLVSLYLISLLVACSGGDKPPVSGFTENKAPIASISLVNNLVQQGDVVVIDGTQSNDPDDDSINYQWKVNAPDGSALAQITNNTKIEFIAKVIGTYEVSLTVTDDKSAEGKASLQVTVVEKSQMLAVISTADSVKQGDTVTVSGENSELFKTTNFNWEIIEKPVSSLAKLSSLSSVETYFNADKVGDYKVKLTLTDIDGAIVTAEEIITADSIIVNSVPTVRINTTQVKVEANIALTLSGSASDPDGDELSFVWQVIKQPDNSQFTLSDATTNEATFSSNYYGEFIAELTVSDGVTSVKKSHTFSVTAVNVAPIAAINFNQYSVTQGENITLYGVGVDPDGDGSNGSLTYKWQLMSKPVGSVTEMTNTSSQNGNLHLDKEGDYLISLEVSDHSLTSEPATKLIRAAINHPPVIQPVAIPDNVTAGNQISLTVNATDVEGAAMTYQWEVTDKPAGANPVFSNSAAATTEFTPDIAGWYTLEVNAHDGIQWAEIAHTFIIIVN